MSKIDLCSMNRRFFAFGLSALMSDQEMDQRIDNTLDGAFDLADDDCYSRLCPVDDDHQGCPPLNGQTPTPAIE